VALKKPWKHRFGTSGSATFQCFSNTFEDTQEGTCTSTPQ